MADLFRGYDGSLIRQLDHFYIGYSFSVVGAFVGLVYGFIDGAIGGALFAWLYNKIWRADHSKSVKCRLAVLGRFCRLAI